MALPNHTAGPPEGAFRRKAAQELPVELDHKVDAVLVVDDWPTVPHHYGDARVHHRL